MSCGDKLLKLLQQRTKNSCKKDKVADRLLALAEELNKKKKGCHNCGCERINDQRMDIETHDGTEFRINVK